MDLSYEFSFRPNMTVYWAKGQPKPVRTVISEGRKRHGDGPFLVVKVVPLARKDYESAGHFQIVTIRTLEGIEVSLSGACFQPPVASGRGNLPPGAVLV